MERVGLDYCSKLTGREESENLLTIPDIYEENSVNSIDLSNYVLKL